MSRFFNEESLPGANGESVGPAVRGKQVPGLARWSLVLGLLSLVSAACGGPLLAALALVFGIVASIQIGKYPERYRGIWLARGGIVASVVGLILFAAMTWWIAPNLREAAEAAAPDGARSPLEQAEQNILAKRGERIGFGNSDDARKLADSFAEQMKTIREAGFSGGGGAGVSLSDGEFLTHCELHEDTCAFLVHVPRLRKFDDEAKVALNDVAWLIAQHLLAESPFPEDGELAVGVKGIALYDDIRVGRHLKAIPDGERQPGLERRGLEKTALVRFFPEPSPPGSPDPASTPSTGPAQPETTTPTKP